MSRDAVIKSWLASMSKSELIDQLLFWHDTAIEHGRMYNAIKDENAKLRELVGDIWEFGFSNSAGANSVKEWYRVRDELEQRVYAALGMEVDA